MTEQDILAPTWALSSLRGHRVIWCVICVGYTGFPVPRDLRDTPVLLDSKSLAAPHHPALDLQGQVQSEARPWTGVPVSLLQCG